MDFSYPAYAQAPWTQPAWHGGRPRQPRAPWQPSRASPPWQPAYWNRRHETRSKREQEVAAELDRIAADAGLSVPKPSRADRMRDTAHGIRDLEKLLSGTGEATSKLLLEAQARLRQRARSQLPTEDKRLEAMRDLAASSVRLTRAKKHAQEAQSLLERAEEAYARAQEDLREAEEEAAYRAAAQAREQTALPEHLHPPSHQQCLRDPAALLQTLQLVASMGTVAQDGSVVLPPQAADKVRVALAQVAAANSQPAAPTSGLATPPARRSASPAGSNGTPDPDAAMQDADLLDYLQRAVGTPPMSPSRGPPTAPVRRPGLPRGGSGSVARRASRAASRSHLRWR